MGFWGFGVLGRRINLARGIRVGVLRNDRCDLPGGKLRTPRAIGENLRRTRRCIGARRIVVPADLGGISDYETGHTSRHFLAPSAGTPTRRRRYPLPGVDIARHRQRNKGERVKGHPSHAVGVVQFCELAHSSRESARIARASESPLSHARERSAAPTGVERVGRVSPAVASAQRLESRRGFCVRVDPAAGLWLNRL